MIEIVEMDDTDEIVNEPEGVENNENTDKISGSGVLGIRERCKDLESKDGPHSRGGTCLCTELTNVKGTKRSKENKEPKPKVANQADTNSRRRKTGFWNKLGERIFKV